MKNQREEMSNGKKRAKDRKKKERKQVICIADRSNIKPGVGEGSEIKVTGGTGEEEEGLILGCYQPTALMQIPAASTTPVTPPAPGFMDGWMIRSFVRSSALDCCTETHPLLASHTLCRKKLLISRSANVSSYKEKRRPGRARLKAGNGVYACVSACVRVCGR